MGILQAFPSFASQTDVKTISSSGKIVEQLATPFGIQTHNIAYGLWPPISEEEIQHLAQFDLLDIGPEIGSEVERIKALDPNIIIIAYRSIMSMHTYYDDWVEADAHEDWFLHDVNGNRIRAVSANLASWYGMDVGNPGWQEHFANYVKNILETYPALDGIFIDNAWDSFRYNVWNVPKEELPADLGSRWYNDMLEMITFVKETIGNKLLIVNTDNNGEYVDASDGKMQEGFVHASWESLDYFRGSFDWENRVDSLNDISQKGKYYLAHSGTLIPENPTEAELNKIHDIMVYCFTSYLLGVNGEKASFGFNMIKSKDGSLGYYPEFDVSLGSPLNDYYSVGSVYARDFADGKVLVNPKTSIDAVDLGSEYKTLDGQTVTTITLNAKSGIILLKP